MVGSLPDDSFVLVMSHSHALDEAITGAALAEHRFAFVGLIGSATKRARFSKRFASRGFDRDLIESLVCPIGLENIRSKKPGAIAASTVAQLLIIDEQLAQDQKQDGQGAAIGEPAL